MCTGSEGAGLRVHRKTPPCGRGSLPMMPVERRSQAQSGNRTASPNLGNGRRDVDSNISTASWGSAGEGRHISEPGGAGILYGALTLRA